MRRIYLAGPIQADPINATDWREYLVKELSQVGWTGIIPPGMLVVDLEKQGDDFKGWIRSGNWELFQKEFNIVESGDIRALKGCQAIIIYLPELLWSWGTKGEIYYAYYLMDIPIYLVYPNPVSTCSFWLLNVVKSRGEVFKTFPEFVRYLKERRGEMRKNKVRNDMFKVELEQLLDQLAQIQSKVDGLQTTLQRYITYYEFDVKLKEEK